MQPLSSAGPATEPVLAEPRFSGTPASVAVREHVPVKRRIRARDVITTLPVALVFTIRDFQTRYKQSLLGPLWLIVQPLSMVAGFTVIFGSVAEVDTGPVPYVLFSLVGTTVWLTFQLSVLYGTRSIVANKAMVKSLPVPRLTFVTSTLLSSLPQLAFTTTLTLVAIVIAGRPMLPQMLLLPVCVAWLLVFTYVVTLPLAAWHARFRDVGATIPFLFQAGVLLSPVAYPLSEAPPTLATILQLNPMSGIIETWRWCLLGSEVAPLALAVALAATGVLAVFGWWTFARAEVRFADVV
jgi:lipopolysaccharide transport system permease protein